MQMTGVQSNPDLVVESERLQRFEMAGLHADRAVSLEVVQRRKEHFNSVVVSFCL